MSGILAIVVVVVLLYAVYSVGGKWLLPYWHERRLKRFQQQYFDEHPTVTESRYRERKKEQQENKSIIDMKRPTRR